MTEQKILEKKKRELEKLVSARKAQENALQERIQNAEEAKAAAEAVMEKAAEADNMTAYINAKNDRDGAQDMIEFCKDRLAAIDTPYDVDVCNAAMAAVKGEFSELQKNAMQEMAQLFEKASSVAGALIDAHSRKRDFCAWVLKDLLRTPDRNLSFVSAGEISFVWQLKNLLDSRLENSFKDVGR